MEASTTSVNNLQPEGALSGETELVRKTVTGETSKNDSMKMEQVNITPSMFYDILKQSREVLMRPMLLMTGGLPKSGKSQAVKQLLQIESDGSSCSQQGFACYDMIAVVSKQKEIDETTKIGSSQLFHDFGFLAGLKTSLQDEYRKISSFTEDGPQSALDSDDIHREHRMSLKATWEKLMGDRNSAESQLLQSNELAKGPALVKIWDRRFDSFSSQFIRCFSGHFYNSYMWSFTDIERDLPHLHFPPSKNDTQLMSRRSRIQYLLNGPSKLTSKLNGTRHDVCTIFAIDSNCKIDELHNQVCELQNECQLAAPQFGCSELISNNVIPLSSNTRSDNKKTLIRQLHQIASKASQMIPLSHLFLRGSLELESSVFMRREDLKRKARLCGIDDESFDEFCKSFTSFGSIIDVGLVSTSDIIIVKPDEFLTTLDQTFDFKKIKDDPVTYNGILRGDIAPYILGEDHQMFLEVLEAVGLATSVAEGQCSPSQGGRCFYIPSLRLHGEEKLDFCFHRIHLVTSMRFPSISLIVALTKHLLQAIPSSQLILSMERSKTRVKSPKSEIEIIFHGEVIEFVVLNEQDKRFIVEIVKACKKLPHQLTNRYGEAKFSFSVLCEKHHDHMLAINFYRKRHILPIDDELIDCDICKLTESMKIWSSAINEVKLDEKFKLNGKLTGDDIKRITREISTYERVHVLAFFQALGLDRQLPDDQSQWEDILMAAIFDWKIQPHKESTKKKMAVILIELHMEFKHSHTESKVRFKQLARELDLQTLTMEQIKNLSKYYRLEPVQQLGDLQKDRKKEEERMQSMVQAHIQEQGKLNIKVIKGMLYGPPRVGKTSLKKRLIEEELTGISPSTGIDSPCTIPLYHDTEVTATLVANDVRKSHEMEWKPLEIKETLETCLSFLTEISSPTASNQLNETRSSISQEGDTNTPSSSESITTSNVIMNSQSHSQPSGSSSLEDDTTSESITTSNAVMNPQPHSQPSCSVEIRSSISLEVDITSESITNPNIVNPQSQQGDSVDEVPPLIIDLIKKGDWSKVSKELKGIEDVTLFQMIDVGGQPEFHEILPLLLTGPALYLLFIRLDQELDEMYAYQYQHKDGSNSISYTSHLTVFQVLHQFLSAIGSSSDDDTSAIIIGTHCDKVNEEKYKEIDSDLKNKMEGNAYFKHIKHRGSDNIVFPVNNVSGKMEDDIIPLRKRIKQALSNFKGESFPTTFALFYYLLQYQPNKKILTLNEARDLAKGLKIDGIVEDVLKFIHNRFGSVLYYDDVYNEDEKKLVFCDPNVILQAVNELVAVCFGANPDDTAIANDLRQTGTITPDNFKKLCQFFDNDSRLKDYIINLLKRRHILSTIIVESNEKYFLPCLLNVCKDTRPVKQCQEELAPLLIKMSLKNNSKYTTIPPGLFSSIIVKLSNPSQSSETGTWTLVDGDENRFKNKISFNFFYSQELVQVDLFAQTQWIEIRMKEMSPVTAPMIRKDVKAAIEDIKESQTLLGQILSACTLKFGFYCYQSEPFHFAEYMDRVTKLNCTGCQDRLHEMKPNQKIWFDEPSLSTNQTTTIDGAQPMTQQQLTEAIEPETKDLARLLDPVKTQWRAIGCQLGIEEHELDSIGKDSTLSDTDKLTKVCQLWKDKRTTEVSWRKILEVIRNPPIQNEVVCQQIEKFLGIHPTQISSMGTNQPTGTGLNFQLEDAIKLSKAISVYHHDHVSEFVKKLGQEKPIPHAQPDQEENSRIWQWIIMEAISSWMMKTENKGSNKEKMAIILNDLHDKFQGDPTCSFKQLAREYLQNDVGETIETN